MPRETEYRSKGKKVSKMTRDGLVERDAATGEERRVSQRGQDFNLRDAPQAPPGPAPGGSVRQALHDNAARSRSGHTRHTRQQEDAPPGYDRQAGPPSGDAYHDALYNERTPSEHQHNEAPGSPGASPVSYDRRDSRRSPDHSPRRESSSDTADRRQHGSVYQRRFTEENPAPDGRPPDPERVSPPDTVTPATDTPTASDTVMPAADTPMVHDGLSYENAGRTVLSEIPADTTAPVPEPARDTCPGRLRFDDAQPTASSGTKPAQHGAAYQRRFTGDAANPGGRAASDASSPAAPPRRESKLEFAKDEQPPDAPRDRGLEKAGRKLDKTTAKLDQAREKLPTKRKARITKEFDADTGKPKRRLSFEKEVKTRRQHVKGPLPLRPVKAGANALIAYGHKKIHQVEGDNVAVEAAHKGELVLEGAVRKGYRLHKTRPYRRVAKLQHKAAKQSVKLSYRQALHDNPKLKSNLFSRMAQKRKIKRQYAKIAREARKTARRAKAAASAAGKVTAFVARHPLLFGIIALILLLVMFIAGAFSSCSQIATGGLSSVVGSSYLANDADIDTAELSYTGWETDLLLEIENAETAYPSYDEYRYNVDDVGHDPHELMAFLTTVYQDFTAAEAEAILQEIFAEQYTLEYVPEVEIRYSDPSDSDGDGDYGAYEWHILNVNLTALSFTDVIASRIDSTQRERFDLLMTTYGNRQYLVNPFSFNWMPYVTDYYGWRIHPITGAKDYHKGIDIGVAQGTEILAGHDGTVVSAGGAGGYGLVVTLDDGEGLVSKYAHCSELLVSAGREVKKGDVIAKVGSTGDSTGPHLHLEIIKNGQYLNPLYFAITGDDGSGSIPPGQPGGPDIPEYPGEPMGDGSYAALMEEAQKHLGKPYVFGAKGPDSFDCSGFVCWSLTKSGVRSIATNAQGLYNASTPVSAENASPGDLIFFEGTYSTSNTVTHVGIYIGNGQMIHSGKPCQYASFETNYWQDHFYAFGRISG